MNQDSMEQLLDPSFSSVYGDTNECCSCNLVHNDLPNQCNETKQEPFEHASWYDNMDQPSFANQTILQCSEFDMEQQIEEEIENHKQRLFQIISEHRGSDPAYAYNFQETQAPEMSVVPQSPNIACNNRSMSSVSQDSLYSSLPSEPTSYRFDEASNVDLENQLNRELLEITALCMKICRKFAG